jgi:hypothetical protein
VRDRALRVEREADSPTCCRISVGNDLRDMVIGNRGLTLGMQEGAGEWGLELSLWRSAGKRIELI